MTADLDLQTALARVWNLEHDRGRPTSPDHVRIRWNAEKSRGEFELRDAAGVIATGTLQFNLAGAEPALEGALDEAAIKRYMAASWNQKFPSRPTSEATIKVQWLSSARAEIELGNEHEVFGAAEWTRLGSFPPMIAGPYRVPARPW